MSNLPANIKSLSDKLSQLLKKHTAVLKENELLNREVTLLKKKEEQYDQTIQLLEQKVHILRASAGNMTETDQRQFEKRINQYIKEIDHCINMLSE